MTHDVIEGDALERMSGMESASFDAMLCDPPYGIAFMGKEWDHGVPSVTTWREALRVLKPGAFALVACGTRTQHRMATALEDAGFEIRDVIAWVYGSGFPKSHDVSKSIDRAAGAEREVIAAGRPVKRMIPGADQDATGSWIKDNGREYQPGTSIPITPEAQRWQGYGTALKPAMELWTLMRKPPEGTVAQNALTHGTGALNIDGTRVPVNDAAYARNASDNRTRGMEFGMAAGHAHDAGRWPSNVVHDGSDEVTDLFPSTGVSRGGNSQHVNRDVYGTYNAEPDGVDPGYGDSGSAARFFYVAKASAEERDAGLALRPKQPAGVKNGSGRGYSAGDPYAEVQYRNPHPTVKPIALTTYLARLILPPGRDTPRRILVPFAGVGSEMIGARLAGWESVTGIEIDAEYARIARARLEHHTGGRLW